MQQKLFSLCVGLALAFGAVPQTAQSQTIRSTAPVLLRGAQPALSASAATVSAITHCGQTLQPNTAYVLSGDIGSEETSLCLNLVGPNLTINLDGHTIRGTIKGAGIDQNGLHIYNGSIYCLDYSEEMPGCLYVNAAGTNLHAMVEIDHLTVENYSTTSASSARNIMVDLGSIAKTTIVGPNVKIHDIKSTSATGLQSTRIVNLQVQGTAHENAGFAEFYNNETICKSTAAACQGIVAYGLYNVKVHNNSVYNQLSDPRSTETPRGVLCDQTDGCEIYSNNIWARDGRAVRMRGTSAKHGPNSVHNNVIREVLAGSNPNHVAAFHLGDPDSGTEVENAIVTQNLIYFTSGQVFMARSATGINITGNTVIGTGDVNMLDLRFDGAASGAAISNTTIIGGQGINFCESGSVGKVCRSGDASGVCKLNNNGC